MVEEGLEEAVREPWTSARRDARRGSTVLVVRAMLRAAIDNDVEEGGCFTIYIH